MKNIAENKVNTLIQRYKSNTILMLIICILFLLLGYSDSVKDSNMYINGNKVNLKYKIYTDNSQQYIHMEDLINTFSDNIYYDKISRILILTTYDNLQKIELDNEVYMVKYNQDRYCNIKQIANELGYMLIVCEGNIYILDNKHVDATVINNRTEVYSITNNRVVCFLDKATKIKADGSSIEDDTSKMIKVQANVGDKTYYGYVFKQNIEYVYDINKDEQNNKKFILVKVDKKIEDSTDISNIDAVAINMYRLSGENSISKLEHTNNAPQNLDVYLTINNGQNLANYDSDIVTAMLNSQINREKIITQLLEKSENLCGINLDFEKFKVSDKDIYTQFVKELAAALHMNNKKIIVNVPSNNYIDIEKVGSVADYIIVSPYYARTLSSNISGPISPVSYVEETIKQTLSTNIDKSKVILELPAYTILWTERKGTVINAEYYNMQTAQEYLIKNNLQTQIYKNSGQNYISYTKGITTYKMWLEDIDSILKKTEIAKEYNLAGISIYKSGMEVKNLYKEIVKFFR